MDIRQIMVLSALIISIAGIFGMNYFEKEMLPLIIPLSIVVIIGAGSLTADVIKTRRL
ncbi:hypothetical protein [Marinococcus halotolerans]|uniref:hypothetical protein n=1 Tax=Marinococcus halotolerans TaxID=301092 RepID=UPI0003B6CE1E|nr:hypothetical protein [Marinococcus halotolerans]